MADWGSDELELVRRCREGSEAAFATLVAQHRPRLYTLAYRLTGDVATAEDVVQETFLAAFRGLDRFEPKPGLAPWLNTIAIRTAAKAATERRKGPASLQAPVGRGSVAGNGHAAGETALGDALVDLDPGGDPARAAELGELRDAVSGAIADLPFPQRVAVTLRHVMGMEYADAAVAMDVPLNTFKSHLLRGTRSLRDTLAPRLGPDVLEGVPVEGSAGRGGSAGPVAAPDAEPALGTSGSGSQA